MAAAGGAPVRLRLQFDFPPPGSPGCALCWLLLEPGQARLVTDLLSIIRHRFGFSRRARLSLFLDGALLPPTESARLVRDNDALRVTLEEIAEEGCEEADDDFYAPNDKKRHKRRQKAQGLSRSGEEKHQREKKKNKYSPECSSGREGTSGDVSDTRKKSKKRKRREENSGTVPRPSEGKKGRADRPPKLQKAQKEERPAAKAKDGRRAALPAAKAAHGRVGGSAPLMAAKSTSKNLTAEAQKQRVGTSESSSTSSDSDSSESNVKQSKSSHRPAAAALPRDKAQTAVTAAACNQMANAEHCSKAAVSKNAKKSHSSSSDSDSSSEDERAAPAQGSTTEQVLPNSAAAAQTGPTGAPKARSSSSSSDSSDSDTIVIKKPAANAGLSNSIARNGSKQSPAGIQGPAAGLGRGRGRAVGEGNFWRGPRGRGFRGMVRGRGRGESPGFFYSYSSEGQKQRQLHEAVTNTSVPVQNAVDVPKRDYSVLPLLAAPPQVGERIAFKRLELNENYSPEVSSYKEGRIISWNADKKQIELEILSSPASQIAKEPGKFDLVYQSADGAELIEYAVPQDTKITESWDSLIEPRLIVEPPMNGSGIENGAV